jgi:WXG100 family type VII secretion target
MSNGVIRIVHGDFEEASAELKSLGTSLSECRVALKNSYTAMRAGWSGSAARAFDERASKLLADCAVLVRKMDIIAVDIKRAGDAMQESDQQLAGSM